MQGSGDVFLSRLGEQLWLGRKIHQVDVGEVSLINYKEAGGQPHKSQGSWKSFPGGEFGQLEEEGLPSSKVLGGGC